MSVENVLIVDTFLGREDHGIFTCSLILRGESFGISFGGYSLDTYDEKERKRKGTAFGMDFIDSILKTMKVDQWEQLRNKYCRIKTDGNEIIAIGHLIEDKWFYPKELVVKYAVTK